MLRGALSLDQLDVRQRAPDGTRNGTARSRATGAKMEKKKKNSLEYKKKKLSLKNIIVMILAVIIMYLYSASLASSVSLTPIAEKRIGDKR